MKITIYDVEVECRKYCEQNFNRSNIPKYRKYFNEWWRNLTLPQKLYFYAYSQGKKTFLQEDEN